MKNMYSNGKYIENHPNWHEEDSKWKADQIIKIIQDNNLNPKSICEIGCGAGGVLRALSMNLGEKVLFYGYEVSPQAFKLCKNKKSINVKYYLKDLLKQEKAHFDIVLAIDVFEHVEDFYGFLKTLKTKGRYKIFHIPLDLSVQSVFRCHPILKERNKSGHIHYFTKDTALASLEDSGYKIIDHFYTASALDLPDRGLKANLMKIPRSLCFKFNRDLTVRILGGYSLLVLTE